MYLGVLRIKFSRDGLARDRGDGESSTYVMLAACYIVDHQLS